MVRGFVRTSGVEITLLLVTPAALVMAAVPAFPCRARELVMSAAMVYGFAVFVNDSVPTMKEGVSTLTVVGPVMIVLKVATSPANVGGPAGVQLPEPDQLLGVAAVFHVYDVGNRNAV